MKTASISEVKNRLSSYVDLVRHGETVVITDRGRPVAHLVPAERSRDVDTEHLRLSLEQQGVIRRAVTRPKRDLLRRLGPPPTASGDILQNLLDEREEGR
jgi:prevent-host-death family protein